MNKIMKQLAALDFGLMLAEAHAETGTGATIINNYRRYCSENPVNCAVVNNFIREAKGCTYDNGVVNVLGKLTSFINENQISWQIASACEAIQNNANPRNYLNRNAANQAEQLLEQDEQGVRNYIKAGALKNVMFCEAFRNIAKCVFNDSMKYVDEAVDYEKSNPISYVHRTDDAAYFRVMNRTFKRDAEGKICEEACADNNFNLINNILESSIVSINGDEMFINYDNVEYQISESGKCVRLSETAELTLETSQLREYNNIALQGMMPTKRAKAAGVLETIAKITESFDNIVTVDCATIYKTKDDIFFVIEGVDNCYAQLISSTHCNHRWSINENAIETVKFIKEKTHVNLMEHFQEKVDEEIKQLENEKQTQIFEALKEDKKTSYKQRIEALTERYKDNPAMLAILAKTAAEINKI